MWGQVRRRRLNWQHPEIDLRAILVDDSLPELRLLHRLGRGGVPVNFPVTQRRQERIRWQGHCMLGGPALSVSEAGKRFPE